MPKLLTLTTPDPSPLILHMCKPMHKPLSEPAPSQFTAFLPSPSRPRSMSNWLCQLRLAPAYTQAQGQCYSQAVGDLAFTASSPRPQSAGNSHSHGSISSRTTTSTSGANTNVHGRYQRRSVGGVAKNSGSGPRPLGPPNGPGRPGARRPTYAHGSSMRVHPSLLPPTPWMSPMNLPLAPDLGSYYPSGPCAGAETTAITTTVAATGSDVWKPLATAAAASPLSQGQTLSPSNSTTTSMSLASTSLSFGATRCRRECPDPCHEHDDEREREHKHALSIAPSSFSNFPSGLDGLGADAQNSPHYHHQPPPLSAVSGLGEHVLRFPVRSWRQHGSWRGRMELGGLQKEDHSRSRCGGCTKADLPHAQRMDFISFVWLYGWSMYWCHGLVHRDCEAEVAEYGMDWRATLRSRLRGRDGSGEGDRDGLASWEQEPESILLISTLPSNHWHTWPRI